MTPEGIRDAVWSKAIESGYSAEELIRLMAAVIQGDASGLESGNPEFKSIDGSKARVVGTYSAGTRTITDRDET
jgi:hypothetical protein